MIVFKSFNIGVLFSLLCVACSGTMHGSSAIGGGLHSAPEPAVESCRLSQREAVTAPAPERYALLAEGCADLMSMPLCREAIRLSAQAAPNLRLQMVAVACQQAYCFLLTNEQSELCGLRPATAPLDELAEAWNSFVMAVLPLELGIDADSSLGQLLISTMGPLLFASIDLSGTSTVQEELIPQRPRLFVRLERIGTEFRVGATLSDSAIFGPWTLPLAPDEGDFSGLLENALRQAGGGPATVTVIGNIPQTVVHNLSEALRAGGIDDVTYSD